VQLAGGELGEGEVRCVEMLVGWWTEAARSDPGVVAPDARTLVRTPRGVQVTLRALSGSRFFAAIGQRALLGDLRQVRAYRSKPGIRQEVRGRVAKVVEDDVRVLVTLGSPLGIANLIFDRLQPVPQPAKDAGSSPRGHWPGVGRAWTNIADEADVVALVKDLRPAFGPQLDCWIINNGAHAHDVKPYLTAVETGRAILTGLAQE
jgi:hypothetical protein